MSRPIGRPAAIMRQPATVEERKRAPIYCAAKVLINDGLRKGNVSKCLLRIKFI